MNEHTRDINMARVERDIEKLSEFNATPGDGITRLTYSEEDDRARKYIINEMKNFDLNIEVDGIGNIVGKLEGQDQSLGSVMTGSHLDTVKNGGKYDGVVGVVGGLEVIRTIKENNISTENPLELIIFVEEEGTTFGSTLIGSKVFTGKYNIEDIKRHKDQDGKSMYERAKEFGLNPDKMIETKDRNIKAMIELHIEQSIVLEKNNLNIGIVDDIAGMKWFNVNLRGEANHAGATPMNLRKDVLVVASEIIKEIQNIVNKSKSGSIVGTVGKIDCEPNVPNVIPEKVNFTLDLRDVNKQALEETSKRINNNIKEICHENEIDYSIELMGESSPIQLSNKLKKAARKSAEERDYSFKIMNSGAVHDVGILADITEAGLLFVPSVDGKSHNPEEFTSYVDIERGCNLLLDTILQLST